MEKINDKLYNWASILDINARLQAEMTARLDVVEGVRLMPDAHLGMGSTVGSVIATNGAVLPAAVGVDIGCGMAAVKFDMTADQLPDTLDSFLPVVEKAIPAGVGQGHAHNSQAAETWFRNNTANFTTNIGGKLASTGLAQFGSLGSGNHFFEVSLDENDGVWIVLHSGSRGLGNQLAMRHIADAKKLMIDRKVHIEHKDLSYFREEDDGFQLYIGDMLAAQDYAMANRQHMLKNAIDVFRKHLARKVGIVQTINCHHNFTQQETVEHPDLSEVRRQKAEAIASMNFEEASLLRDVEKDLEGASRKLWITRKGAIKADKGDLGVIPGSMGTDSYIIEGLGNPDSYCSCSHGAGRVLSRKAAKEQFTSKDLREAMGDRVWSTMHAKALVDEIPSAYKPIEIVMEDQKDLVRPLYKLSQILSYKGTS